MKVVRFLERKLVIQFFGIMLIVAPFANMALHLFLIKKNSGLLWVQFQIWPLLKNTPTISLLLTLCSLIIGVKLLSGVAQAWRYVLIFLGAHIVLQVLNINDKAWKGPLAWPSFLLNTGLFFFIFDQLVWKLSDTLHAATPVAAAKKVVHLKSYRKILFNFGQQKAWGEMKTLSSETISVKCLSSVAAPTYESLQNSIVQINFSKDVIVDIKFDYQDNDYYYFKPLNMDTDKINKLNAWLRKIAV